MKKLTVVLVFALALGVRSILAAPPYEMSVTSFCIPGYPDPGVMVVLTNHTNEQILATLEIPEFGYTRTINAVQITWIVHERAINGGSVYLTIASPSSEEQTTLTGEYPGITCPQSGNDGEELPTTTFHCTLPNVEELAWGYYFIYEVVPENRIVHIKHEGIEVSPLELGGSWEGEIEVLDENGNVLTTFEVIDRHNPNPWERCTLSTER